MTSISVWLLVSLLISLAANIGLVWYLRKLLTKFLFISQNLGDLVEVVENYYNHLKHVNNMETYNGDETIEYLLRHTQGLIDLMEDYRDVYDISIPLEEQETQTDDTENINPKAQEAPSNPIEVDEENVFYAGTRRRNS